uniref:Uncharacterized protein n=1 Tax=Meloidogyne enterolobii TaxID=390850 RepID=A0A6V7U3V8_MELEN|nr:unnamed protein product [Meloidogyne enterolobii]
MSTPFNSCTFGLSSTKDDYFPFSTGFAFFCMTISTIWCFCCSKKKKGDDKEDNKGQSKVKSPPIPAAKKTDSAAKKRRYSATPDKAKRQAAQARVRIPVVKPVVFGNPKAKVGGDGGSKTKKPRPLLA